LNSNNASDVPDVSWRVLIKVLVLSGEQTCQQERRMNKLTNVALALGVCGLGATGCDQGAISATIPGQTPAYAEVDAGNQPEFPPNDWIFRPAELPSGFTAYECTFPLAAGVTADASSACQEKQWGTSGIFREAIRNLHVASLPACNNGPADITNEIRICSLDWDPGMVTPWGASVGGKHCAIATISLECTA
jgi:hypothetical protein